MFDIEKVKIFASKASPEILIGVGIGGIIVATVMACKATLRVEDELDEIQKKVEEVKAIEPVDEKDEKALKQNLTKTYICGAVKIASLYTPSIIIGGLSVGSIMYGHDILSKRNVALAAFAEMLDKKYRSYQDRVVEAIGEEAEKKIRYGFDTKDVDYIHVDEEFNEKKKSKKNAKVVSKENCSPYARFFDEGCVNWTKSPEKNLYFLRIMQAQANDLLHARGHIFLNEVYDMLGIPRTEDGQLVGWIIGGNDVDFGIYNMYKEANRDFVNGYEPVVLLDFNVDGLIYNKL